MDTINKLHEEVSSTRSVFSYKKYAITIIEAEKNGDFKDLSDAPYMLESGLIVNPLVQFSMENSTKLDEISELASLLDVPPPHDSDIDREKTWQEIVELVKGL